MATCAKCGDEREHLQRDRIVPGYLGGKYTDDNIQYICANCHDEKSRREGRDYHARKFKECRRGFEKWSPMKRRHLPQIAVMTRCRQKRRALGWSQEKVAELAKVPQPYVSKIELRRTDVAKEDLAAVARVLGLEPDQLMEEVGS